MGPHCIHSRGLIIGSGVLNVDAVLELALVNQYSHLKEAGPVEMREIAIRSPQLLERAERRRWPLPFNIGFVRL